MTFDNPTLFNLLLVQALASALLLLMLMGTRASPAARWAQACMGLQGLGWLSLAGAAYGSERLLASLAMLAFSASLSALWWALRLWLSPRPGKTLAMLAPLLMPLVYALQFDDAAFRAVWSHYWLALQLLMLGLSLALPDKPSPAQPVPASANRRWRMLMLLAVLPLALVCLLRGSIGAFGAALPSLFGTAPINTALGLLCQMALTLALPAFVLAWRGEAETELARLAQTDGLTGLADRRAFAGRAVEMISMARRHGEPLALMLLDIDALKAINTRHGRDAGDRALALFGSCLQAQMRLGDLAGRVGGEEFAVLMAHSEALGPQALDKRMRDALAARAVKELGFALDFSAGWAKLRHGDRNIEDLLRRAETALYEAKRGGRGLLVAEPGLEERPEVSELARALH